MKDVGEGIVDAVGGAIGWATRKVGSSFPRRSASRLTECPQVEGVERFDEGVENSYDQGKQEGERTGW